MLARKTDDTGQCFIGLSDLGEVPGKKKYDAAGPEVHIHQHEQTNNLKSSTIRLSLINPQHCSNVKEEKNKTKQSKQKSYNRYHLL